jgi:hypothetical protein
LQDTNFLEALGELLRFSGANLLELRKGEVQLEKHGNPKIHLLKE